MVPSGVPGTVVNEAVGTQGGFQCVMMGPGGQLQQVQMPQNQMFFTMPQMMGQMQAGQPQVQQQSSVITMVPAQDGTGEPAAKVRRIGDAEVSAAAGHGVVAAEAQPMQSVTAKSAADAASGSCHKY